jgi:hypothetical protein
VTRVSLLGVVLCLPALAGCGASTPATSDAGQLQALADKYAIAIVTDGPGAVSTTHGTITARQAGPRALATYLPVFVFEWGLYPRELVRRSRLERIVLCRGLTFGGQRRSGVPDYEHHTLYLDVVAGANNTSYWRKVIHHEFYHIIDFQDDGMVYTDERWARLNPADFRYGTGGRDVQESSRRSLPADRPGFLTSYSLSGVEEDKAEVFAHLMVVGEQVESQAKGDAVLRAKVSRMKELMKSFCSAIDEQFWEKVKQVDRSGKGL